MLLDSAGRFVNTTIFFVSRETGMDALSVSPGVMLDWGSHLG